MIEYWDIYGKRIVNVYDHKTWISLALEDGVRIHIHKGHIEKEEDLRLLDIAKTSADLDGQRDGRNYKRE